MPDVSDVDAALIAVLQGDATLKGLCPDGVFVDVAPPNSKRFVVIHVEDAYDEPQYGRCAFEETLYLVKVVGLTTAMTGPQVKQAAARIHDLLQDKPLTVPGYAFMAMYRDQNRGRIRLEEVDDVDPSIRWYHRGGFYTVTATPIL